MFKKILKILLCLILVFTFTFVKPKEDLEKAYAVIPVAAWAVSIIGGLIIDYAIDMGVKFIDNKAKEGFKNKVLNDIWKKNDIKLQEIKPTKKNGLKWLFKAPKWLLSIIAGAVTNELLETEKEDKERTEERKEGYKEKFDFGLNTESKDPFYNTSLNISLIQHKSGIAEDYKFSMYMNQFLNYRATPVAFGQRVKLEISPYSDFRDSTVFYVLGCKYESVIQADWMESAEKPSSAVFFANYCTKNPVATTATSETYYGGYGLKAGVGMLSAWSAYEKYLQLLEQSHTKVYYANGLMIPQGTDSYVKFPTDITNIDIDKFDFDLLPAPLRKDRDFEFEIKNPTLVNNWETIKDGEEFEWTVIENDVVNQGDNIYNTIINYDYSPVINNDYVITPDKQEDIDNQLPSTGGNGGKDVDKLDGTLIAYVKNAYEYATGLIDTAVDGLKKLSSGAVGLINLYKIYMSWLPIEIQTVMYSGLGIMIGLRVFRK